MSSSRYDKRGVSATKDEVHQAIKHLDKGIFPNAFCKIMPDIVSGDPTYCNIMHADTAGTKTSLAYMYWKETGDLSVWEGIAQDALVMNLDDMACVGCVEDIVISSTIGRNKNLVSGEVIARLIQSAVDFCENMAKHGVTLHLAGGETADVGDVVRTIDVGYTTFGRMPREKVIQNDIQAGAVIVGFASYGQATYETAYNGGMGSNGLTSARHDMFKKEYATRYPDAFDAHVPEEVVFTGPYDVLDEVRLPDGSLTNAGKLVLSPTRTYLPVIKSLLEEIGANHIQSLIHCSGGGQTKVSKFLGNHKAIKNNLLPVPQLFTMIQEASGTSWKEMYQVFNMGHRLEAYLPAPFAEKAVEIGQRFGIDTQIIGEVVAANQPLVEIQSPYGTFLYD